MSAATGPPPGDRRCLPRWALALAWTWVLGGFGLLLLRLAPLLRR